MTQDRTVFRMIDWPKAMEAQWGDVVKLATTRGQLREEWISTNRPYPAPRSDSLPRFSLIGAAGTIAAIPVCAQGGQHFGSRPARDAVDKCEILAPHRARECVTATGAPLRACIDPATPLKGVAFVLESAMAGSVPAGAAKKAKKASAGK